MLKVVLAIAVLMIAGISPGHAGPFSPPSLYATTVATKASHRCRPCCGCDRRAETSYRYRTPGYHLHRNRSGVVYYGPTRIYRAHPSVEYQGPPPQMFYYTYSREPFYDRIW